MKVTNASEALVKLNQKTGILAGEGKGIQWWLSIEEYDLIFQATQAVAPTDFNHDDFKIGDFA